MVRQHSGIKNFILIGYLGGGVDFVNFDVVDILSKNKIQVLSSLIMLPPKRYYGTVDVTPSFYHGITSLSDAWGGIMDHSGHHQQCFFVCQELESTWDITMDQSLFTCLSN